ncbi:MAG: hypothetical protein O2951_16200 [Bacteroidetes bacterium]|nr:hypothetical protein [Bacteroidota bacterium]
MDLVIKDDSGGQGHAHKREDHENYFPTKCGSPWYRLQWALSTIPALFQTYQVNAKRNT